MTYNKNGKITMIKKIYVYSICLVIISYITGCKFFNQPMLDYLEEWTNTAQINKHTFDGTYPEAEGYTNIPSGKDRVITYYLVNPQNYALDSTVTFAHDDSLVVDNNTPSDFATVEQDATDKSIIRLTLNNSVGATGMLPLDGDGTDISPTLTITEPNSGRTFGSYTVPVRVNSAPAGISSPIILYNQTDNTQTDNTYVICFNMPDMNTHSSIHRDIVSLTVSGFYNKTYTVTAPDNSSDNGLTGQDKISDTFGNYKPVGDGGAFFGDENNRFVAIETGISLNTIPDPRCTITLTDSSGLTSAVTASTEAPPLPAVTASSGSGTLEPGVPVIFNQETANSTITLTLSSTEGVSVSGGSFIGNTITGTGGGSGITLTFVKKGTYTVTATAGGVPGARDTTTTFTYTVPYSAVYIANTTAGGSDGTGTGAPDNPYATLTKAADAIGGEGVIYVDGETDTSEYAHTSGTLTLRGYNDGGTITNSSGRVLNITGGTVTLGDNITLTGQINGHGGAVLVKGGNFTMESGSTIAGSSAKGTDASGGGVAVEDGSTFIMNDGARIIRCQSENVGGGVCVYGSTFIMNGGVIGGSDSDSNSTRWGGGVYIGSGCVVTMSGNSEISYNKAENVGTGTGIGGGGVHLSAITDSTFTMNGNAKINYNSSEELGGGVCFGNPRSIFFMNDNAQIKYNQAASSGGGVYFENGDTFTVSGSPDITDNTLVDSSTNNVTLADGKTISIGAGGLTETARIGVTTEGNPGRDGTKITDTAVANGDVIFTSNYYVDNKADGVWLRDIEVIYQVGNEPETEATFTEARTELNKSSGGTITLLKDISLTQTAEITGGDKAGINLDTGEGGTPLTIDLNGHTLSGNGSASVLSVSTGFLEIKDFSANPDGTGGTGKITGGGGSSGGGIDVKTGGVLRLVSGAITGNTASEGGGVNVSGTFTMFGGSIAGNTAVNGGGVYVSSGGVFTMRGGSISGNGNRYTTELGAGVYIEKDNFSDKFGTFTMTGGSITGNTLKDTSGGGAYNVAGGGVYVPSGVIFNLGGAPIIKDNKQPYPSGSRENNVYLDQSATITILPDLERTGNGKVKIFVDDMMNFRVITNGWNSGEGQHPFEGDTAEFTSSGPGYYHEFEIQNNELCAKKVMKSEP